MPKPTLTYFDAPSRGEAIRLAYALNGVELDDQRVDNAAFQKLKPDLPNQTLPHLKAGEAQFNNSIAALVYAGQMGKLVPSDSVQYVNLIELLCSVEEVFEGISKVHHASNDEMKKKTKEALIAKSKIALPALELFITHKGKDGFAVGNALTVGDIQVFCVVMTIKSILCAGAPEVRKDVEASKTVMGVFNKVKEHPKVKAFYADHSNYGTF
eukprot:Selendium_serpulae@DN4561_c0_g1_i2.p1